MQEEQIVAKIAQNTPSPTVHTPAEPDAPAPQGTSEPAVTFKMDELNQYKMHSYFDESYSEGSPLAPRLEYIYEEIANRIGTDEYGLVMAEVQNLIRLIGIKDSPNRVYKLQEWLKLDNISKKAQTEMLTLSHG